MPLRNALPSLRSGVMSALPPPGRKREPLAKSAPASSASTKRGISAGIGRAVGVEHHDDVAGDGGEAGAQGVALAAAVLGEDADIGVGMAGCIDRFVLGVAVDEDHLVQVLAAAGRARADVAGLVHRRDDDADLRPALAPPVGAGVGHALTSGKGFDVDQGHAADLARRDGRRVKQVQRPRQQADRHAGRLECADDIEESLVIGVAAGDHDAVGVVAVDDLQRCGAVGRFRVVVVGGYGADDGGPSSQRLVRLEPLGRRGFADQDPALDVVELADMAPADRPPDGVEQDEPEPEQELRRDREIGDQRGRPDEAGRHQDPDHRPRGPVFFAERL